MNGQVRNVRALNLQSEHTMVQVSNTQANRGYENGVKPGMKPLTVVKDDIEGACPPYTALGRKNWGMKLVHRESMKPGYETMGMKAGYENAV